MQTSDAPHQWVRPAGTVAGLAAFTAALAGAIITIQAANSAASAGRDQAGHSVMPVQPRHLAPIDFARRHEHVALLIRRDASTVVLDMDALESIDGAQELTAHWRHFHSDNAHLTCWVFARDSGDALRAAGMLAQQDCNRVVVAL